jgi:hypothetical protein
MYLIIEKIKYNLSPDSYYVKDKSTDIDIAEDKLRGYNLINTDKDKTYHIIKFQETLVLTEEMRIAS